VRVGLVILPSDPWNVARRQWEWAEDAGFSTGWTYDHIRWGGMPDGPWYSAIPVLSAAAVVTRRLRLGTLVATPNFRHPVALAREAITLDDLSEGRLDLGLGPGTEGHDASILGQTPWSRRERLARFEEFVDVLSTVVNGAARARTSMRTPHYAAVDAPSTPGTRQHPLPLTIAAGGRSGLAVAAKHGQQWVTIGPTGTSERTPDSILQSVHRQVEMLAEACRTMERDMPAKVLLWTPTEPVISSTDQFDELAAPYAGLGFDEIVLHHPDQTGPYAGSSKVFERIAAAHQS
jgi:alkanesulfonate monooxygenase SsuD/methylene tetrahydromethanopterin reductase-like flavin-dependent oxidoreductase (luciferase family)